MTERLEDPQRADKEREALDKLLNATWSEKLGSGVLPYGISVCLTPAEWIEARNAIYSTPRSAGTASIEGPRECPRRGTCGPHNCCYPSCRYAPSASEAIVATHRLPSEDEAGAVRGILQIIRGNLSATFAKVREHCELRGDDLDLWPMWAQEAEGYVTEEGAAFLIFEVMQAKHRATSRASDSRMTPK